MIKVKAYYTDGREVEMQFLNESDMEWYLHMDGDHLLRYDIIWNSENEPKN